MTASGQRSNSVSMHCSCPFKRVRHRTWMLRPAAVASDSGSKNGMMEAMSNEGPHMRDYEQKSEMLWDESTQTQTEYNFSLSKGNMTSYSHHYHPPNTIFATAIGPIPFACSDPLVVHSTFPGEVTFLADIPRGLGGR